MSCIPVSPFVSQRKVWVGNLVNTGQEVHQEEEVQEEEEEEGEEDTPVYKGTILVTEKHRADLNFFGHFLPRLSRNDHSWVISKAHFCWVHSISGTLILTRIFPLFWARATHPYHSG